MLRRQRRRRYRLEGGLPFDARLEVALWFALRGRQKQGRVEAAYAVKG